MEYKLNDPSGGNDSNDCAVRALSNATNIPYWQAYDLIKWLGRKRFHSTKNWMIFEAVKILGMIPARPIKRSISLAKFVKAFPLGSYYVHSRNHAWCVKNGIVFDSWKVGSKTRIKYFAQMV
jgi:hypothetical protein